MAELARQALNMHSILAPPAGLHPLSLGSAGSCVTCRCLLWEVCAHVPRHVLLPSSPPAAKKTRKEKRKQWDLLNDSKAIWLRKASVSGARKGGRSVDLPTYLPGVIWTRLCR